MVSKTAFTLLVLLGLSPFSVRSASGANASVSYAYSFQLAKPVGSFLQTVSASSVTGAACTSAQDCQSKCPTTDFIAGNANADSVQQQVERNLLASMSTRHTEDRCIHGFLAE